MLIVMDLMKSSLLLRLHILPRTLKKNFRNNNRRARAKNNVEPKNFKRNEPTKVNNTDKPKEKVGQTSNNSMGQ